MSCDMQKYMSYCIMVSFQLPKHIPTHPYATQPAVYLVVISHPKHICIHIRVGNEYLELRGSSRSNFGLPCILAPRLLALNHLALRHLALNHLALNHLAPNHLALRLLALNHLAIWHLALNHLAPRHLAPVKKALNIIYSI